MTRREYEQLRDIMMKVSTVESQLHGLAEKLAELKREMYTVLYKEPPE